MNTCMYITYIYIYTDTHTYVYYTYIYTHTYIHGVKFPCIYMHSCGRPRHTHIHIRVQASERAADSARQSASALRSCTYTCT